MKGQGWSGTQAWAAVLVALAVGGWGAEEARAAASGNPVVSPDKGEFVLSVETGYLERDVEGGGTEGELGSYCMAFKGTYGITPRLSLFGRLGLADLRLDRAGFTGSLGPTLGAGVTYVFFRDADDPSLSLLGTGSYNHYESEEGDLQLKGDEVSGALLLTKGQGDLLLFGGLHLSTLGLSGEQGLPDTDAAEKIGLLAGVDYGITESIYLTGEIHLFDEFAVSAGIGFGFGR